MFLTASLRRSTIRVEDPPMAPLPKCMYSLVALGVIMGGAGKADAQASYVYTTLDIPGWNVAAQGINNAGQIVGLYENAIVSHGFLLSGSSYTMLDVPGAFVTAATGINNAGQIVGDSNLGGFLLSGGSYTKFQAPGSTVVNSVGAINDSGKIVGVYGGNHGFLLSGGIFTTIDVPGADQT